MPQHVEAVAFYGNIDENSLILKGRLTFSNGYSCEVGKFNLDGKETLVPLPPQENVKWIKFEIIESKGEHAGISEWEILNNTKERIRILQICVNGNFAYDWYVYPNEEAIVSAYTYGIDGDLNWFIDGQSATLEKINSRIKRLKTKVKIRTEMKENPNVWSEIVISPAKNLKQLWFRATMVSDKTYVMVKKQLQKIPHHKLRRLKTK